MDNVIKLALERWKQAEEGSRETRKKGLEDLKFRAGEQWPDNVQTARQLDARPCLTINRVPQFVRQVTNDARMNRPSIKISAVEDSDVETAEIYEGLCRHIQVSSNAEVAYDTAMDYAATMGFGYIRVITEYCDEDSFDQDIKIKRIKNPFMVYFDPFSSETDGSDAKFAFICTDMLKDEFKKQYPNAKVTGDLMMESEGDTKADWITGETVRVAEYFCIEEREETLLLLDDGNTMLKAQYEKMLNAGQVLPMVVKERKTSVRKVMWRKITSAEVLEEREWAGKYIPIVPVYGEDLDVDGQRELIGMVRYLKDPQRMYNYWSTAQTEAIALSPKAPFVGAEGQFEGYEHQWAAANRENKAFLVYKPTTIDNILVPPPQRQQAEPPVQAMVQAIVQASEDMKATTGIYDASLGMRSNETSGRAIQARQAEGDIANFHFIDNLSRSIRHVGVILVDLIPKIYDSARVVRILGEDGESELVKINQIFQDKSGQPKQIDMTVGKYDVQVNVGPSYATKRQEAADMMTQLAQAYPQLMQIAGDILVKNMDWPGADDIAKRLKAMLPPQIQDEEEGKPEIPPALMAQMEQAQQMIDMLTQQVNQLTTEKESKVVELESKERIAAQDNQTKLAIESYKAETNGNLQILLMEMKQIQERLNILGANEPVDTTSSNDNTMSEATVAA